MLSDDLRSKAAKIEDRIDEMWGLSEEGRAMVAECSPEIMLKAAEEIDSLRAENERLRTANARLGERAAMADEMAAKLRSVERPYEMDEHNHDWLSRYEKLKGDADGHA